VRLSIESDGLRDTAVMRYRGRLVRHWRKSFSGRATAADWQLDRAKGRAQ
jgi:hypothetical protein